MRFLRSFFVIFALFAAAPSALADQFDMRLDGLFEELGREYVAEPQVLMTRIVEIWSEAPSPTVNLLFERALEALETGEVELADTLVGEINYLAPSFAQGWSLRGNVERVLADSDAARDAAQKALELEPRHFIAATDLGDYFRDNGQMARAFDYYQQAAKWNPHYPRARLGLELTRDLGAGREI